MKFKYKGELKMVSTAITTRKNAFINTQSEESDYSVLANKPHYYGSITKISINNDISYLNRGSVYYLRDNPHKDESTYHPYLVIQSMYLDKIGKVAVFGITSTPSTINMIPIIIKGSIGYIDPHQPYYYKVTEFFERGTRYVGTIVNQAVLDLVTNFYGLYLGMNLVKSEDEIINDYLEYTKDFTERSKDLQIYKPKCIKENKSDGLELTISFTKKYTADPKEDDDETLLDNVDNVDTDEEEFVETTDTDITEDSSKETILIDTNSQAVQSMCAMIENQSGNTLQLPRFVSKMTKDEVIVFLAYIKLNDIELASIVYNCCTKTIFQKRKKLEELYNVIYT